MRRLAASLLAGLALTVVAPATRSGADAPCISADPNQLESAVLQANVILVAKVEALPSGIELLPETFLKGTVSRAAVQPAESPGLPAGCPPAELPEGARVLAFLRTMSGTPEWPAASAVFLLSDGAATRLDGAPTAIPESELVRRIRNLTGQQAAPPAANESGAGIDWSGTILPVGALLLAVFGIGLVLMRTWHRIDPS